MRAPGLFARAKSIWLFAAAAVCAWLSGICWYLFYTLYWMHRHLFDLQGQYFAPQDLVVYHAQNGWLLLSALVFLSLALAGVHRWFRRR